MSLFASLLDGLDSGFLWLSSTIKQSFSDYCDLETAEDSAILVARDGSLMSVVRIDGSKSLIGAKNFYSNIVEPLDGALSQPFSGKTHMIQFYFVQDPERTESEIRRFLEPAAQTLERLSLDMSDMLEERVKNLSNWTNYEACYMVLWTRPIGLTKADVKYDAKKKAAAFKNVTAPMTRSQNPFAAVSVLHDRHNSFTDGVIADLSRCGLASVLLDAPDACREIRTSIDPDWTAPEWKPVLPGDKVTPSLRKGFLEAEEWDIVWPKLNKQLAPRDATIVSDSMVQIGDKLYAPVYIDLFPRDPAPFRELYGRLMNRNLPWRASFLLEGDGLSAVGFKKMVAAILGFASGDNKLINQSIDKLMELKNQAETIVKIRACFCTWGSASNKEEVGRRASDLARAIEAWGTCDVAELTGDPLAGLASSALGFSYSSIGTAAAAPLKDVLSMMPLARPSSPWKSGAVTFRSPDGKLLPYQPGSSLQTTWISLIFAKPGSGKSVLLNMTNLALCLSPGIKRLPRIAIVDIGPSSSGLISLLQEALPAGKKHLAAYHRLKMTREFAVNPFDTQLGARFPSALERQFLINFLTLLVTDVTQPNPFTGMAGLVTAVIDEMYRKASDKEQPHPYALGVEPQVDTAMESIGMHIDKKTTWWEVVDRLFIKGYIHEAVIGQRHAVPVVAEAALCAQDEKIKNTYGKVKIETGEDLITGFNRMVADSLQYYPILARPTAFDIGESRVVSLDLDEVAKTGGPVADRQTAVMYMLARYLLAKDFYMTESALNEMPYPAHLDCPSNVPANEYKDHHRVRIEEIREDLKRICYDEFHRTSKAQTVRDQILVDMREGRKWAVDVTLASQALEDFDPTMIEFATGIFVMDGGNAKTVEKISQVFGFQDPAEQSALQYSVHGPKKGGGTFLAKFSTNQGWYTMLLTSTLGPIELWAFSTTAEDVSIRNRLYQKVGPKIARKVLAQKYAGGSAKTDVEERKERLRSNGVTIDGDGSNILEAIVAELVELKNQMEARGVFRDSQGGKRG
jgi:intracellular multiplication protein IcmB